MMIFNQFYSYWGSSFKKVSQLINLNLTFKTFWKDINVITANYAKHILPSKELDVWDNMV